MNLDLVNHEHEPRKINLPYRDSKCKALLSSFRFEEANRVEKLGQGDWGGVLLVAELEFELRGGKTCIRYMHFMHIMWVYNIGNTKTYVEGMLVDLWLLISLFR